jgi:hypothetical protein
VAEWLFGNEQLGGRFQDWAKVTPRHNSFIDALFNQSVTLSQLQEVKVTTVLIKIVMENESDEIG